MQHLQLILVLERVYLNIWVDTTKGGEVIWLLNAIEQNKTYYEHSLDFAL